MANRKTYVVPPRMHYDVWETWDDALDFKPRFICSCVKENEALNVIYGLVAGAEKAGVAYGQTIYKIRARPTVEHTIHSLRV